MKTKIIFGAAICALLSAGCDGGSEKIFFASEARVPAVVSEPSPTVKGLSKAEEEQIDMVVLSNLLDRHLSDNGDYTALFLQADDTVVATMMKKYAGHKPPIKESYHIDLRSNQSPLDRDTGKPVMIFGAEVNDPNADGSVDVIGRWYAGGAVQGYYTFNLTRTGDEWTIAGVK